MYAALGNHRQEWVKNAETGTPFVDNNVRFAFNPIRPASAAAVPDPSRPFSALLGSLRWHLGSGTRTSRSRRIASASLGGEVHLNPADVKALGLAGTDRVRIRSDAGAIERTCVADPGISPGRVFIPLGFSGNDAMALAPLESLKNTASGWRSCRVNIEKI